MIYRLTILAVLLALTTLLQSCASGSGSFSSNKVSWSDAKSIFEISSSGKSNNDAIDAIDVWGAKSFGSWQKVRQTKLEDRGIIVFRYKVSYCADMVSTEVKRKDENTFLVSFSNISGDRECMVRAENLVYLVEEFLATSKTIEKAIAEF